MDNFDTYYRKIKECLHTKLFAIWTENASTLNSKVLSSISGRHTQKLNNLSEGKSRSVFSNCLRLHGLFSSWNSLDQNTEVDSLSLLQGIFPTQASNPGLLHWRWTLYQLSHTKEAQEYWSWYPFCFLFHFHIGHYRVLSRGPCVIK